MSSKESANLLEESTEGSTYGTTSYPGPSTKSKTTWRTNIPEFTASAPTIMEPSKDSPRPPKPSNRRTIESSDSPPIHPWRTLVTCSCPESCTRAPTGSPTQMNGENEQLTTCGSFFYNYKNTAIMLRNSKFIHIFQVLFLLIQISAVIMGLIFESKCNESELLPVYGGLTGFIGLALTGFWISNSCCNRHDHFGCETQKILFFANFVLYAISIIVDLGLFLSMSPSFDESDPHYCNSTLYYYTLYKHVATGVAAILAAILYLPGSHSYRCCFSSYFNTPHQ